MSSSAERKVMVPGSPMPGPAPEKKKVRRFKRSRTSLLAMGEPMIWLSGGALVICLVMIIGLLMLILLFGMSTFWPLNVIKVTTRDGNIYMGEVTRSETYKPQPGALNALPADAVEKAEAEMGENEGWVQRRLVRTGNFRITQNHFQWVSDFNIKTREDPKWALVMERLEWGRFYGFPEAFGVVTTTIGSNGEFLSHDEKKEKALKEVAEFEPEFGGKAEILATVWLDEQEKRTFLAADELDRAMDIAGVAEVVRGPEATWEAFNRYHSDVRKRWRLRRDLEKYDTGKVNTIQEQARLRMREAELEMQDAEEEYGRSSAKCAAAVKAFEDRKSDYQEVLVKANEDFAGLRRQIDEINQKNGRYLMLMRTAGEGKQPAQQTMLRAEDIVRYYAANQLTTGEKIRVYLSRWWEYLSDEPREANSEGGVFPAIFGTILMTMLMALAVVPFGVLAALYLREYAKAGPVVSAVRIAVNNLAGVPSIVFGVFGLGFFCYGVGSFIDGGPTYVLPRPSWFSVLAVVAVTGFVAFFSFLGGMTRPGHRVTQRQIALKYVSGLLWAACAITVLVLVSTTPLFDGFYRSSLPNPTFGKGALIWASMTLALLTLPVVIVSTEEALAAVPNSMREGSYACGASKWQTIKRIVLPRAMPGIMTGMILAMARGAGEVAPLMLVGAVKLAPELPFDWSLPFGINRSFMHLGFHIYDVGFQSQNSEAAKPMVFTTTLLLISIIAILNVSAIWLRSRLRRKFLESAF